MPQLAQDTFSAADGTALQSHNPAWTVRAGAFAIHSGAVHASAAATECAAAFTGAAWPSDQYAECTITAAGSGLIAAGPAVRVSASGALDYYGYYGSGAASSSGIFAVIAGAWIDLSGALPGALAVGDVLRLEARGTTLTAKKNGLTVWSGSDARISGGAAGLCGYGSSTSLRMDGWSAGNLDADVHSLAASAITAGVPVLGQPGLAQAQQLAALPFTGAGVMLPTPALVSAHGLAANPPALNAPRLGQPILIQQHALAADSLRLAAVVLGRPRAPGAAIPGAVAALRVAVVGAEARRGDIDREDRQQEITQEKRTHGISA